MLLIVVVVTKAFRDPLCETFYWKAAGNLGPNLEGLPASLEDF